MMCECVCVSVCVAIFCLNVEESEEKNASKQCMFSKKLLPMMKGCNPLLNLPNVPLENTDGLQPHITGAHPKWIVWICHWLCSDADIVYCIQFLYLKYFNSWIAEVFSVIKTQLYLYCILSFPFSLHSSCLEIMKLYF